MNDSPAKTKYQAFTEEQFEFSANLTRIHPQARRAAYLILVKQYKPEDAGLEAGYSIASAKSAASRAAVNIAKAANACPCCGRAF